MSIQLPKDFQRSHYCGDLCLDHLNQSVQLAGWVLSRRDHGKLMFFDLWDYRGVVQVVLDSSEATSTSLVDKVAKLRLGFVLALKGKVTLRPEGMKNPKIKTGEIELKLKELFLLNDSLPFPLQLDDKNLSEDVKGHYRYLLLREETLQNNLRFRHKVLQKVRSFLSQEGFCEVETPILYKSTPEGARDYLVPSRTHPGFCYALTQSPQQLKQLLMMGGMDRYFQIARCFRDEDLRSDRQPEFSQIDLEMSFTQAQDIRAINEKLLRYIWKELKGKELPKPLPQMTYQEALQNYGSDCPDLRSDLKIKSFSEVCKACDLELFKKVLSQKKGLFAGFHLPPSLGKQISRSFLDRLNHKVKSWGAPGLLWIKCEGNNKSSSSLRSHLSPSQIECFEKAAGGQGLLLLLGGLRDKVEPLLGRLRTYLLHEFKLIDEQKESLLWITDFPLFDQDEEGLWHSVHHPFTAPKTEEALEAFLKNPSPETLPIAQAYDLVHNGHEIAGGSLRIHKANLQRKIFAFLGLNHEVVEERFGFFIKALEYGCPPHGGMAWGLDRLIMLLCGAKSLREVIAFPKTAQATCTMSGCPNSVDREQWAELKLRPALSIPKKEQKKIQDVLYRKFKSEFSTSERNQKEAGNWLKLDGTNLTGIEVKGIKFAMDNGRPLNLEGKTLKNWHFVNMDLSKSNFKKATLEECDFVSCNLQDSNFQETILRKCNFIKFNLQNVNFKDAKVLSCNLNLQFK